MEPPKLAERPCRLFKSGNLFNYYDDVKHHEGEPSLIGHVT